MTDYDYDDPNRPFNPILDGEDAAMVATAKRHKQALEYAQQQEQLQEDRKIVDDAFKAELEKEGLSQTEYNEILKQEPGLLRDQFVEGTKALVGKAVRRRNKKGQLLPHSEVAPRDIPQEEMTTRATADARGLAQPPARQPAQQGTGGSANRQFLDAIGAKVAKGYVPNEDEEKLIAGAIVEG